MAKKREDMNEVQRVLNRLRSRVIRGAKRLDRLVPGWAQRVDLNTFRFTSCRTCVAGQLGWSRVLEQPSKTGELWFLRTEDRSLAERFGFSAPLEDDEFLRQRGGHLPAWMMKPESYYSAAPTPAFKWMERVWKTEIQKRRAA